MAAEPKRVLIVHSFGSATPPFSVHAVAFETELVAKMGERIDLDEVSLDMARYSDPDMQEALVDYLETRNTKWQPDLVVPIGAPAGIFVSKYRDRLFAETPILLSSLDQRLLPEDALAKNAAYIGQKFDLQGLIDDILQLAPNTKYIALVAGVTPLEQYWTEAFRKTIAPLTDRVHVIYFNDLSFDQMLERAAKLPPDSYIFMLVLLRDAAGVTHNTDEALQKLHAVANAPINSIFDHQIGLGIVGGRLYQSEQVGTEAAETAVRILRGEPASSFSPKLIERLPPRYDWRELHHWKIDQKHLPAGSTILFRPPTAWQEYREWIISGIAVFVVETALIAALLANLIKRRRAERSLTESEARFRRMADAAPVMMWMSAADKLCTFFNKAWLDFTGRQMEEELGNGWSEGVHRDDLDRCLATYTRAFDARQSFTMQYRLRRRDGQYRYINDEGVPRYHGKGEFVGYIGVCVDVSDVLQKEQELHESEERVSLAAEAAHLGIWELDNTTGSVWMSDKARELFQFDSGANVSYLSFQSRLHPDDRARHDAAVKYAIQAQANYEIEYRVLLPKGSQRWLAGRGRCVPDANGKFTRLLSVSADITERTQAQELFRIATEASPNGILLVNGNGDIVLINARVEELFGYHRDELVGTPFETLVSEDQATNDSSSSARIFGVQKRENFDWDGEFIGRRKDGTEFPVEVGLNPVESPEGILFLARVADLSERKRAEEEAMRRREEISRLQRIGLLAEMTTSIAHEINQPLSGIIMNAGTALRFMERPNADLQELREILRDVQADAHRAHRVIRNIRETLRKGAVVRQRVAINEVVTGVMHMVQPEAAVHACELEASLGNDLPFIAADPVQIQQVLINLLANAFDAVEKMPSNRRKVEVTTARVDRAVRVTVRDYGTGIAEDARERLFEQFFSTKAQGVGMGLAIVWSIIDAHSGTIRAENVDGKGAQFTFSLPVSNPTAK
jgi:PAS domain S-box-containing protein